MKFEIEENTPMGVSMISLRCPSSLTRLLLIRHIQAIVLGISLLSGVSAFAQFESDIPKDPAVLQQRLKDIAEADNPDDPSLAFEDMRDALKLANSFKETRTPSLRQHLVQLDTNEKDFQTKLASARSEVQVCNKDTSAQALKTLTSNMGFNSTLIPYSYSKTVAAIQGLQGAAPEAVCTSLKANQGQTSLEAMFADDLQEDRRNSQQLLVAATQLGDAYAKRYTALKELRIKLTKESGLRGDMLWIVAGVCLFACITLSVIRLYTPDQAMEFIKSGQLIQFPTVMILLVVIVVLGLTSILQENTLGTLLGGVAGYVLSQGVGRAAFRDAERSGAGSLRVHQVSDATKITPDSSKA